MVSAIVISHDSAGSIERCLESISARETIVVDNSDDDVTAELVARRFPAVRLLREPNRGFGAAANAGMRQASERYFLLLNADVWLVGDAIDRLVEFAEANPRVGVVGPRLLNPDGSVQPSMRGFPTLWRLATQYFFLNRLAPRSRALNAFYAGGLDARELHDVEFVVGACLLVRRAAVEEVGPFDEDFFMFAEEADWCLRFRERGWRTVFFPRAEAVHLGGASTAAAWAPGRRYREQELSHLRFFAKHRDLATAERARRLLAWGYRVRAALSREPRSGVYRSVARWLSSAPAGELLESRG